MVSQLEQRLSYSSTPLNDTQTEQIVQILAATAPAAGPSNRNDATSYLQAIPGGAQAVAMLGGGARISDSAITQAQGVLSPPQVAALQSLQQEQQAAAELRQKLRSRNPGPANGNVPSPQPTPPKSD